ncbi:SHD1 domain-containing protein [Bremerella sp. JC817]|uniref:SHD1 domain-containing protein n=1 Tax=Bremerella sp. JC817 TaxID=3231756 RepID=UPI0034576EC6
MFHPRALRGQRFWLASLFLCAIPLPTFAGEPTGALVKFAESRTWSDDSGKFQIGGSLKLATENEVQILKSDGLVVTVPLNKLSANDQKFIADFLKAEAAQNDPSNPFAGGAPSNPFSGGKPAAAMPATATQPPAANGNLPKVSAATAGARPLNITAGRAFWSVKPPIALPKVESQDSVLPISFLKPRRGKMVAAAAGRSPTIFLNVYEEGRRADENYGRFALVDPKSGQTSPVTDFPQAWKMLCVAPNGKMIAAVEIKGFDKGNELGIFKVEGTTVIPVVQFTAGGGDWAEIQQANFLPNDRIVVIDQKKKLTVWDISNPNAVRALVQGELQSTNVKSTPAGELMIVPMKNNIAVVDTNTFEVAGVINVGEDISHLGVSADGKRLAAKQWNNLVICSMEDGSVIKTIPADSGSHFAVEWVGDYVKVGEVLYDVNLGIPYWKYDNWAMAKVLYDNVLFSLFDERDGTVMAINTLPHKTAIQSGEGIDPKSVFAMTPGSKVRVVTKTDSISAEEQQKLQEAIAACITKAGWTRDDSSSIVMEFSIQQGEEKEEEYVTQKNRFGPGMIPPPFMGGRPSGPTEKVKFRPWNHSVEVKENQSVLYRNNYQVGAPSRFQSEEGESTQQAVLKLIKPRPSWFEGVNIPSHLMKAGNQSGLGKSSITATGLK